MSQGNTKASGARLVLAFVHADEANAAGRNLVAQRRREEEEALREARRQRRERQQRARSVLTWALIWGGLMAALRLAYVSFLPLRDGESLNAEWYLPLALGIAACLLLSYPYVSGERRREFLGLLGWSVFVLTPAALIVVGFTATGLVDTTGLDETSVHIPIFGWAWTSFWTLVGGTLRYTHQGNGAARNRILADPRKWAMLILVTASLAILLGSALSRAAQAASVQGLTEMAASDNPSPISQEPELEPSPSDSAQTVPTQETTEVRPAPAQPQTTGETTATTMPSPNWSVLLPYWGDVSCPPDEILTYGLCPGGEVTATVTLLTETDRPGHNVTLEILVPEYLISVKDSPTFQLDIVETQAEVTFTLEALNDVDPVRLPPECPTLSISRDDCTATFAGQDGHKYVETRVEFVLRGDNFDELRFTEGITVAVRAEGP